jgi:hypothetical protein
LYKSYFSQKDISLFLKLPNLKILFNSSRKDFILSSNKYKVFTVVLDRLNLYYNLLNIFCFEYGYITTNILYEVKVTKFLLKKFIVLFNSKKTFSITNIRLFLYWFFFKIIIISKIIYKLKIINKKCIVYNDTF